MKDAALVALAKPLTALQLASVMGVSPRGALACISRLKKDKQVYVCSWVIHDYVEYESAEPVYLAGVGEHIPFPSIRSKIKPPSPDKKMRCLELLRTEALTVPQLGIKAGMSRHYAYVVMRGVREHLHICGWFKIGIRGRLAPIYKWGPGEDAVPPLPLDDKTVDARFRMNNPERIKAQREAHFERKRKKKEAFSSCYQQLIGADKPRKPMKDFPTPEPEDEYHD